MAEAKGSADNSWMLASSALVLLMTGPGLALFYGGLVRKKNVLGHHDAELRDDGRDHRDLGDRRLQPGFRIGKQLHRRLPHIFLRGVGTQPDPDYAATIPAQTYMIFS